MEEGRMMEAAAADEQRLTVLAVEIQTIRAQARATVLGAACEIGKRLVEAKGALPFGRWGAWLEANVDCSERQAQQLMALWEEYGKNPNPKALNGLSVSQAAALLAAPEEVRSALIDSGAAEGMSVRALKEEIARQKAEIESRQVTIDALTDDLQAERTERARVASVAEDATRRANADAEEKARLRAEAAKLKAEKAELDRLRAQAVDRAEAAEAAAEEAAQPVIQQVEVIPEELEAELARLRAMEREAPSEPVLLAREHYRIARESFLKILDALNGMDSATRGRYAGAFAMGLREMAMRIEGSTEGE